MIGTKFTDRVIAVVNMAESNFLNRLIKMCINVIPVLNDAYYSSAKETIKERWLKWVKQQQTK